jgi:hypothetical protein
VGVEPEGRGRRRARREARIRGYEGFEASHAGFKGEGVANLAGERPAEKPRARVFCDSNPKEA